MGTLTLTELKEEVRAGLAQRVDLDSRLTRFLNFAQQRLARIHDFEELKTSDSFQITNSGSATDGTITLPNLREVYSIRHIDGSNSKKLSNWTQRRFDRQVPDITYPSRGEPEVYLRWGYKIEIAPLPDQTYTLYRRFTSWPTPLSDASPNAVSDFREKDDVLIELAVARAYWSLGKEDEAKKHEQIALMLLGESANEDATEPDLEMSPSNLDARNQGDPGIGGDYWADPWVKSAP